MKAIAAHRVEADRAFAKPLFIRVDLQGRVQDRLCSDADSLPERHRSLSKTDHIEAFFQRLTSEWINRLGSFIQGAGLPRARKHRSERCRLSIGRRSILRSFFDV